MSATSIKAIEAERELQEARKADGFTGKMETSYIDRMIKDAKRNSMIGDKLQIVVNPIYIYIPSWQRELKLATVHRIATAYNRYEWGNPLVLYYKNKLWAIDGQHRIFGAFKGGKDAVVVEIMECSLREAVELFMNQTKNRNRVWPLDIYNAALEINDPVAVELRDTCHKYNVAVKGEEVDKENTVGVLTPIDFSLKMVKCGTLNKVLNLSSRLQWNGAGEGMYKGKAYTAKPIRSLNNMYANYFNCEKEMEDILVEKCHGAEWFENNGKSDVSESKFLDTLRNIVNQELANRATKAEIIPVPVRKFA